MEPSPSDDRSVMALAMTWVTRAITISFEMVVPGLLGYWLDGLLGTKVLFMILGFGLGISFAIWHLLRITASPNDPKPPGLKSRDQFPDRDQLAP